MRKSETVAFAARRLVLGGTLAMSFGLASADGALAASAETEAAYQNYQRAIKVVELCRDTTFSQDQQDRLAAQIGQNLKENIGLNKLSLMTAAQRDAEKLVGAKGCDSREVQDLESLFDRDLAPGL